ncbi:hypothetical protein BpHYR1_005155 [Brachionus plicatilis]|uniref:Uncharacterized protein n=1 Tax=Brachionus plicatilis TaxID=10195 RepID=A0A3M7SPI4_BRAPC|nr:hypothetical protein BpHYR1_005155 [Brachionus plicatilis]
MKINLEKSRLNNAFKKMPLARIFSCEQVTQSIRFSESCFSNVVFLLSPVAPCVYKTELI